MRAAPLSERHWSTLVSHLEGEFLRALRVSCFLRDINQRTGGEGYPPNSIGSFAATNTTSDRVGNLVAQRDDDMRRGNDRDPLLALLVRLEDLLSQFDKELAKIVSEALRFPQVPYVEEPSVATCSACKTTVSAVGSLANGKCSRCRRSASSSYKANWARKRRNEKNST